MKYPQDSALEPWYLDTSERLIAMSSIVFLIEIIGRIDLVRMSRVLRQM